MVRAADVTAEDLVDSVLNSISTGSSASASSSQASASASSSGSSAASSSSSGSSNAAVHASPTAAPSATTSAPVPATTAPSPTTSVRGSASGSDGSSHGGSGAGMGVGLAVAALVMVACVLLYLRRRRRLRSSKARRAQFGGVDELGPPQPSIELPAPLRPLYRPSQDPGARGSSVLSAGSSRDGGSVFHTVGGLSPGGSARKFGASGYAFRASSLSSASSRGSGSLVETADGGVHVGAGRKLARVLSGREMDEEDAQYAQLRSTSAAPPATIGGGVYTGGQGHGQGLDASSTSSGVAALHDSASSDVFRHGDGLGRPQNQTPSQTPSDAQLKQALDSSLITGRTKRTGSVYDSIPALAGEQMHADAPAQEPAEAPAAPARRAPPPPPPAGVPAFQLLQQQRAADNASFVAPLPTSVASFASADDLEFAMDAPRNSSSASAGRESTMSTASAASSASTDSAGPRGGSLIALAETTRENGHEIAI